MKGTFAIKMLLSYYTALSRNTETPAETKEFRYESNNNFLPQH